MKARTISITVAMVLSAVGSVAEAQLAPGDLGLTGFSYNQFVFVSAGGAVTTVTVTPPFHPSTANTTQSILWLPSQPNSFLVGGFGFVGRVTMTSATTATWTQLATVGEVAQMSLDAAGQVVIVDASTDSFRRMDPVTGALTFIGSFGQPWGTNLNCGVIDPSTGEYFGGGGALWRISGGIATVLVSGFGAFVTASGIELDPFTSDLIVTTIFDNRVRRVTRAGVVSDLIPPGSILRPNGIDVDANGDFLVSDYPNSFPPFHVYRVPNLGGAPVLVATSPSGPAGPSGSTGVAFVGGGPAPYRIALRAFQNGSATLATTGIPALTFDGWTGISATTTSAPGAGSFFGIIADNLTIQLALASLTPSPGNPIHWLAGIAGVYPAVPLSFSAGTFSVLAGLQWDFVSLAFASDGTMTGVSNAIRVSW